MHEKSAGTEPIYAQQSVDGADLKPVLIIWMGILFAFINFYLQAEIWNQFRSYNEGLLCTETQTH
jgi:hypothetical protein